MADPPTDHAPAGDADLVDVLVQTSFMTMAVLSRIGATNHLSLTQLRVLAILRDRRLRMTDLADHLGLDRSTMTGLVDRAEKRGLLARARSTIDGRGMDVFLTEDGSALAAGLSAEVERLLSPMTNELTPTDRRRLTALLSTMLPVHEPSSPS